MFSQLVELQTIRGLSLRQSTNGDPRRVKLDYFQCPAADQKQWYNLHPHLAPPGTTGPCHPTETALPSREYLVFFCEMYEGRLHSTKDYSLGVCRPGAGIQG